MKIGILIDRLNVGGVEKIAIEEVIALREQGVDATLVVLRRKAVVEDAFADLRRNVPTMYLDERLPQPLRWSFQFPFFHFFSSFHLTYPLWLPFVVKKNEFDYLIVHSSYTCLTAMTLKKFRNIRFSAFIWDPTSYILERVYSGTFMKPVLWLMKKMAYGLDRLIINSMDTVLVGGTAHNAFIHKINPNKDIRVIYPSVHPLKKLPAKDDYVLMVTAWKRGKNPEYVVEVARQLPDIHLKMVGKWVEPEYRQEFERLVQDNTLTEQIEIVGAVSEAELADYYARARVLLQTNDDRGFGMPALEAAGSGTTFVIPEGQGVCSLFTDGTDGFYTKERDTPRIVAHLQQLLDDKPKAVRMGKTAWQNVVKNYSWANHAQALIEVVKTNLHMRDG